MSSKHTPGPWVVNINSRIGVYGPRDAIGWPETVVYNAGMPNDETALANAALISAAPEMLSALQGVLESACIDADDGDLALQAISDIRGIARAAIAKAIGKDA